MTLFAVLLGAAAVAFALAKLFHLPPIPLLLVAGISLRLLADRLGFELPADLLRGLIELGLAVLVFTAGTDLSPRRMRGRTKAIVIVAVGQFFMLGLAGLLTARLLGYDWITAGYIGCALSASSTLVAVRHLQQRRQMFEPYGRLVLGVLLLQDVFIILLLVALVRVPQGVASVVEGMVATIGLGGLAWLLHRYAVPWLTENVKLDEEELMLGALGMLFVFSALAYLLDLNFLVGAFCAGFVLSAFPMNGLVRGMLGSLSGFFLALFFICIGLILTLPDPQLLWHGLLLTLVLIVVTVVLVAVLAEKVGYSTRASIESSLLLSQTSEFSLLIALAGLIQGHVSPELFALIVLVTVSTMTLTPFLAREQVAGFLMQLHPRYRKGEGKSADMTGHVVLLGFGSSGSKLLDSLKSAKVSVVVVDEDAAVIRDVIAREVPCIQGDGSSESTLIQANARHAKAVLCSMRRQTDALFAIKWLRGHAPLVMVRTFDEDQARLVENAGGISIRAEEASADRLMEWIELNEKAL